MSKSVLDMSVSLDGFVCGPNETPDNGLGDNGRRLHWWFGEAEGDPDGINAGVMKELLDTVPSAAGRGTVEPANWWHGAHHDGVPVFILSRTKTPAEVEQWPHLTVLDDA